VTTDELATLHAANRTAPDGEVERRMVTLRASLFQRTSLPDDSARAPAASGPRRFGMPEVSREALDGARLREALSSFGSLRVRGLLDASQVRAMREHIDAALVAREAAWRGFPPAQTSPWYVPFEPLIGGKDTRGWVRETGSVLAVESPRALFHLLDVYYDVGVDRVVAELFGERPALSAEKTTLRRVVPAPDHGLGWHQDGRFLGDNIRSLNAWIALSDCGTDAPSLELVPTRLHDFVTTGDASSLDWCVSQANVDRAFPGAVIRPEFRAGDALFFDHLLLHRTWRHERMTQPRYAIESWFFAPSAYPSAQTGLYV
jgi:hypothetical protein